MEVVEEVEEEVVEEVEGGVEEARVVMAVMYSFMERA